METFASGRRETDNDVHTADQTCDNTLCFPKMLPTVPRLMEDVSTVPRRKLGRGLGFQTSRASYDPDVAGSTQGADLAETSDFTETENMTPQALMPRKHIEDALHQILDDIKNKRENDLHILSDVKKDIMNQARRACKMLDEYMTHVNVTKSKQLDQQMRVLMTTLTKIQKLESELDKSKTSLSLLYEDIQGGAPFM